MNQTPPPTLESELLSGLYSEEEKAQILGQIEDAASANRLTVDAGAFRPRKRGVLFPIVVNLVAVLTIVGAWFGASAYFQTKQASLQLKTDQMFSTESKLLTKVLEDSKNQLAAKNAEISKIQGDMANLAKEKADLEKSFASRLSQREKAMKVEMADLLAAEKKRLEEAGYGPAEVERRLKEFELKKTAEFDARLADYRREVQAEIDQRTQAVTALQAKLQSTVVEQERLRSTIATQTKEREAALQSQLSSQAADLEQLTRDKDDLTAFQRSLDPATAEVRAALDAGDHARTQAALLALRQVLAKATASSSEAIRTRAQSQLALAGALDSAVTALEAAPTKAATDATLEALRAQLKKERELSGLQSAETQQSLAAADARARQWASQVDELKLSVAEALGRLDDANAGWAETKAEAARLAQTVAELTVYKTQADTLRSLFLKPYPTARDRFQATLGSEAGQALFPEFPHAWQELEDLLKDAGAVATVRKQAFQDVLTFTSYLQGTSTDAQAAKEATERLSRGDETYRLVVESVQALATGGAHEATVSTATMALYGTVTAVGVDKVTVERLTKVRPQGGQTIELRRVQGRRETVLGRGTIVAATDKKIEVRWPSEAQAPFSGDQAYLVLP